MSQLPREQVYMGFWVDYSKGSVLGSTITTSPNIANVVVALLSIIITFAGSHMWSIIAYTSFAFGAVNSTRDGLHYQRQTLLRNIASPAAILVKAIQIHRQWRRTTAKPGRLNRICMLAFGATLCSAGFLVAGIVSSFIISSTDLEVLAYNNDCGFVDFVAALSDDSSTARMQEYTNNLVRESILYTQQCYNGSSSDPACQIFHTQAIAFNASYNECPFRGICSLEGDRASLRMDTGLMWSDKTFGVNMHPSSALAIRKVTTCAPLNVSQYMRIDNISLIGAVHDLYREALPGEEVVGWHLGEWAPGLAKTNATFTSTTVMLKVPTSYAFDTAWWHYNASETFRNTDWAHGNGIEPIDAFTGITGDLTLASIMPGRVAYHDPVDDPIFLAHQPWRTFNGAQRNVTKFISDNLAGIVGCREQAAEMNLGPEQNATLYLFAYTLINYSAGLPLLRQSDELPLLANKGVWFSAPQSLPANQWELEVKYWKAIVLTMIQKVSTDYATGPRTSGEQYYGLPTSPLGPYDRKLCHAQKMRAPDGFSNINVFGLSFTIAICGFLIALNSSLSPILRYFSRRFNKQWTFVKHWDQEEILQFQRTAYESNGIGTWSGDLPKVPTITNLERFYSLATIVASNEAAALNAPSDELRTQSKSTTIIATAEDDDSGKSVETSLSGVGARKNESHMSNIVLLNSNTPLPPVLEARVVGGGGGGGGGRKSPSTTEKVMQQESEKSTIESFHSTT